MKIDWCVSLGHGAFRLIDDIEIMVEISENCDGSSYDVAIESIWIDGDRYDGGRHPAESRRFDILSERQVDGFWLAIGERIKAELVQDDRFMSAIGDRSSWIYTGRGANDPEGRYRPVL